MPLRLIENVRPVTPTSTGALGRILIDGASIKAIDPAPASIPPDTPCTDGEGMWLTPGLIDLHTHGIGGYLYERSPEDMLAAGPVLAAHGTTCVLPTLVSVMSPAEFPRLERLAGALRRVRGVSMPGFHLEGPFLRLPGAGCTTTAGDVGLLEEVLGACDGKVVAMSVSPDTPGIAPVIDRLVERGVRVFITHTRAGGAQSLDAIARGARHGTHFYNVFEPPDPVEPGCRPVGAVEALLADPRCTVDFIADGVHVDPLAIRAALAAKGAARVALITDSNTGAGLPPGVYEAAGGFPIAVDARVCRVHLPGDARHGSLAGSTLTMDRGLNNLCRWLDGSIADVVAMATSTPAAIAGLPTKGRIASGCDADLVLWRRSDGGRWGVAQTWWSGVKVYDADRPTAESVVGAGAQPVQAT